MVAIQPLISPNLDGLRPTDSFSQLDFKVLVKLFNPAGYASSGSEVINMRVADEQIKRKSGSVSHENSHHCGMEYGLPQALEHCRYVSFESSWMPARFCHASWRRS